MGILSRMKDIMASNINALLDKAENPEKMINQMLRQSREDLADVKKETAAVMANEENARRKVQECQEQIDKRMKAAENALKQGDEAAARDLLQSKDKYAQQLVGLNENYQAAHQDAENMKSMYRKLSNDVDTLEGRADMIKGKAATAKAREHANKITSGKSNMASIEAFDRMEAKVTKQLDTANAAAALDREDSSEDDLITKYSGGSTSAVDDELAAMKARLGLS